LSFRTQGSDETYYRFRALHCLVPVPDYAHVLLCRSLIKRHNQAPGSFCQGLAEIFRYDGGIRDALRGLSGQPHFDATGRYGMSVASIGARGDPVSLPEFHFVEQKQRVQAEQAAENRPVESNTQKLHNAAADLERIGLAFNRKLQFVVDHQSNEVIVKVIDPKTDKVIKVIPPEELQRLHSKLKETISFLFDLEV
jgi:flagellar protein FlaG